MAERLRLAHLATVDISLALLLGTELEEDVAVGFDTFAISAPGPYIQRVENLGVTHVPVDFTRSWSLRQDLRAAHQLNQVIRELDLHILHTHNPKPGVLGRGLGRLAKVPLVVNTCHGLWASPDDRLLKKGVVYGVEAIAGRCSDAELYQNDLDRQTLRSVVPAGHATTVGNGVDLRRFHRNEVAGRRLRSELGVADDMVLIGGVGRLVAEKGLAEFEQAARMLASRGNVVFVWAGPGDPKSSPLPHADSSPVRYLGMVHDTVALYSALDIFVLPSHREGFSRSSMEAAACACALVLSDIRGCREIGTHEEHLLLVPPKQPNQLAAAVARLLDQPRFRHQLAQAAEARAHELFDQRQVAHRSFAAYRKAADRKGLSWSELLPEPVASS